MNSVSVRCVGLIGPGLAGWQASRAVLRGEWPFSKDPLPPLRVEMLPPNERRRTSALIRPALAAALDAVGDGLSEMGDVATVFASSGGDAETVDKICRTLNVASHPVSPTLFHNSVHNAPAGYWAIATGSRAPSSSICAYDGSFAAGLLDAVCQVGAEQRRVLLVAYDVPPPPPLHARRPLTDPFGCALLLDRGPPGPGVEVVLLQEESEDRLADPRLEQLRTGSPAARALPLLVALAKGRPARVVLPYLPGSSVAIRVTGSPA